MAPVWLLCDSHYISPDLEHFEHVSFSCALCSRRGYWGEARGKSSTCLLMLKCKVHAFIVLVSLFV